MLDIKNLRDLVINNVEFKCFKYSHKQNYNENNLYYSIVYNDNEIMYEFSNKIEVIFEYDEKDQDMIKVVFIFSEKINTTINHYVMSKENIYINSKENLDIDKLYEEIDNKLLKIYLEKITL